MNTNTTRAFVLGGLSLAVGVALLLSPLASQSPDGLERVAEDKGFLEKGEAGPTLPAPAPDYKAPGIGADWLSTPVAGVAGTFVTFGFAYGLAHLLSRRSRRNQEN